MITSRTPSHHFFFALQTIVSDASDDIMHLYQKLWKESEQHVLLTLCANLYKAEAQLTEELERLNAKLYQPDFQSTFTHEERLQCRRVLLESIVDKASRLVLTPKSAQH